MRKLHADAIEPVDIIFGQHCDLLDDKVFQNVVHLASSGMVGAGDCGTLLLEAFNGHFETERAQASSHANCMGWASYEHSPSRLQVQESAAVHDRARYILSICANYSEDSRGNEAGCRN